MTVLLTIGLTVVVIGFVFALALSLVTPLGPQRGFAKSKKLPIVLIVGDGGSSGCGSAADGGGCDGGG